MAVPIRWAVLFAAFLTATETARPRVEVASVGARASVMAKEEEAANAADDVAHDAHMKSRSTDGAADDTEVSALTFKTMSDEALSDKASAAIVASLLGVDSSEQAPKAPKAPTNCAEAIAWAKWFNEDGPQDARLTWNLSIASFKAVGVAVFAELGPELATGIPAMAGIMKTSAAMIVMSAQWCKTAGGDTSMEQWCKTVTATLGAACGLTATIASCCMCAAAVGFDIAACGTSGGAATAGTCASVATWAGACGTAAAVIGRLQLCSWMFGKG